MFNTGTIPPPEEKKKLGRPPKWAPDTKAQRNREANQRHHKAKQAAEQDIGDIPPVKDPERRERCRTDLALALKTYFPGIFCDPFSKDHLDVIAKAEIIVKEGGKQALAMPRGFW